MTRTTFMAALVILKAAEDDLLPALGATAPHMIWDPTAALMQRIAAQERADGIFAIDTPMDDLQARGLIDPATRRPVVEAAFGLAVAKGSGLRRPENARELIALLQAVPSVAMSRAGASGIYFESLIDRLGIGAEVRAKALVIPAGLTGEKVRDGHAVLAVQQMSELLAVEGIEILGPLPDDCQQVTRFDAAVFTDAAEPDGARAFIDHLTSAEAARSYLAHGLKVRF
jgi:molybdate transport system substrate-binding protein